MNSKKIGSVTALLASGLLAGGILAGSMTANAADSTTAPTNPASASPTNPNPGNPATSQRSDETLLSGSTADKVKAAALAKYPSATIQRLETDSDGVYEAHVVVNGASMIVQVGKDFTVTGTQTMGAGRGAPATTQG